MSFVVCLLFVYHSRIRRLQLPVEPGQSWLVTYMSNQPSLAGMHLLYTEMYGEVGQILVDKLVTKIGQQQQSPEDSLLYNVGLKL